VHTGDRVNRQFTKHRVKVNIYMSGSINKGLRINFGRHLILLMTRIFTQSSLIVSSLFGKKKITIYKITTWEV